MVAVIDMALSSVPKEKRREIARSMRMNGFEQRGARQCAQCAEIGTLCWKLPNRSHCDKCFVDGVVCRPVSTNQDMHEHVGNFAIGVKYESQVDELFVHGKPEVLTSTTEDLGSPSCPIAGVEQADRNRSPKGETKNSEVKDLLSQNFGRSRRSDILEGGPVREHASPRTPASVQPATRVKMSLKRPTSYSAGTIRVQERKQNFQLARMQTNYQKAGDKSSARQSGASQPHTTMSWSKTREPQSGYRGEDTPCQKNKSRVHGRPLSVQKVGVDRGSTASADAQHGQAVNMNTSGVPESTTSVFAAKYRVYKDKCKRLRQRLKARKLLARAQRAIPDAVPKELEQLRERNRVLNERVIVAEIAQKLYKSMVTGHQTNGTPCKREQ